MIDDMASTYEPIDTSEVTLTSSAEFISIPEWCRRVGVSKDSAYKAARSGRIPGCFVIGRLYRINWPAFLERSGLATGHQLPEEVRGVTITPLHEVGVEPQGRGRVGVA